MTTRNKNRLLGFTIGVNIAAAIATLFAGHSSMLTTHITLVFVLLTLIEREEN